MISEAGLSLIKKWEGLRLEAYQDITGVWTIGYGHTNGVMPVDKITEKQADALLQNDIEWAYKAVMKYDEVYHWTQNEIDALTSFAFNLGASSIAQVTAAGTRSKVEIAEKMLLYYNAGGKKLQGLVNRRKDKHVMFVSSSPQQYELYSSITQYLIELDNLCAKQKTNMECICAVVQGIIKKCEENRC